MEKVINLVSEKAGITTAQAETAVNTVVQFLKNKLPAGMAGQVDAYLKGEGSSGSASGMADKLGGMFGKK